MRANLWSEQMHNNGACIDQNPVSIGKTFNPCTSNACVFELGRHNDLGGPDHIRFIRIAQHEHAQLRMHVAFSQVLRWLVRIAVSGGVFGQALDGPSHTR